ncbi:MAG: beta-propeller domain-containing protein [Candidatus Izemoplasmataceae bacterium]
MRKFLILTMTFFTIIFLTACQSNRVLKNETDFGLAQVQDKADLARLIEKSQTSRGWLNFFSANRSDADAMPEADSGTGENGSSSHSKTNVQVEGIDEGDIVKTDGNMIYTISYNLLTVIEVLSSGEMVIAMQQEMDMFHGWYSDLYITDNYLVVLGYHYQYTYLDSEGHEISPYSGDDSDSDDRTYGYYWYSRSMTIIEIYALDTLELETTIELSGHVATSRLIEDRLVVISTMYVSTGSDEADPRPYFKHDDTLIVPEYSDIKYLPDTVYQSYTIISTIFLEETVTLETDIFLGTYSWGHIYVNQTGIYLASHYYEYTVFGNYKQHGLLVSYIFDEDGSISYGGSGKYKGYIINQFAMDEYDGYFRMVTTEGWGDDVVNRLYVFQRVESDNIRELRVVGLIDEGLGKPRETVRSVRFMGDQATVVTYELTDPFYVVDLSDPTNPTIQGELEITGFSTYMHPWEDGYMIGIGFEANGDFITGIKLALYDITNPELPVETGTPLVISNESNSWQYGEALHNHKAILIAKEHDFIGFSIWRYYYFNHQFRQTSDYIIFNIDKESETPITIEKIITHFDLYDQYKDDYNTNQDWHYYYGFNFSVNRAVYIGDYLFVISNEAITSHDMRDDFELAQALMLRLNLNE